MLARRLARLRGTIRWHLLVQGLVRTVRAGGRVGGGEPGVRSFVADGNGQPRGAGRRWAAWPGRGGVAVDRAAADAAARRSGPGRIGRAAAARTGATDHRRVAASRFVRHARVRFTVVGLGGGTRLCPAIGARRSGCPGRPAALPAELAMLAGLLLVPLVFAAVFPGTTGIWARAGCWPESVRWPQSTYLSLDGLGERTRLLRRAARGWCCSLPPCRPFFAGRWWLEARRPRRAAGGRNRRPARSPDSRRRAAHLSHAGRPQQAGDVHPLRGGRFPLRAAATGRADRSADRGWGRLVRPGADRADRSAGRGRFEAGGPRAGVQSGRNPQGWQRRRAAGLFARDRVGIAAFGQRAAGVGCGGDQG